MDMWASTGWKDYELLDCGKGEKLERWGSYTLVRPDPQAIWNTPRRHPGWKRYDARYARSHTGGGQWVKKDLPQRWQVRYGALTFNIKPMNFKHTGLFPEQAANWDFAMEQIDPAGRPAGLRIESLCLHRRGHPCLRSRWGLCLPCGRGPGDGQLGPGKRQELWSGGRPHPLDCGRLRQICGAGNPSGPAL